jgi:hypothetical protein
VRYFLGVVDILQSWDTGKRLERFAKTAIQCKRGEGRCCCCCCP